jgi:hypothetical protein
MTEKTESRGRGCLFYGLLTLALVFAGMMAGIYFGTRKAVRYAIDTYTTNAPTTIPMLNLPATRQRALATELVKQFEAAANSREPEELVVGEEELNVMIAQSPDLRAFNRNIYLQPQGEELKAFISMPLDQFPQWRDFALKMGGTNYSGRYLNGIAYLNLGVTNGALTAKPRRVEVGGAPLPDQFLKQFPWDAVTQPVNDNAEFRSALQQVESVFVQDGKVHVKLKR